jgi:mannose-6-phosphate isomerase
MQLNPYLVEKPWGGEFISECFQISPKKVLGEAFLVSTLTGNESTVGGHTLTQVLDQKLPYLIKVIDAANNLSIQVHPNDDWAHFLEDSVGKTECWLVIDADETSGVYYGFKEGHSFETLNRIIDEGENAADCLNFLKVKPGDFISVPAGTIHAIGKGVRILEFQQSSGITYRIWDWGREGRELHLEKAKKVTSLGTNIPVIESFYQMQVGQVFFHHEDFTLSKKSMTSIECFSDKILTRFEIDINNFACKIS